MKDRDKSKAPGDVGEADSIVELTPEMELPEGSEVKIIDLTDAIDGPADSPAISPSAPASIDDAPAEVDEMPSPERTGEDLPGHIEQEVDAAFDAVQSPVQEPAPVEETSTVRAEPAAVEEPSDKDTQLFERLSDIPRKVDQAMEMADTRDMPIDKIAPEPAESPATPAEDSDDFTDITADAAELESAMAKFTPDNEDDDILDLSDIIDPAELQAIDNQLVEDVNEIIELTDIVDPADLQVGAVTEDFDDEEILDLTEIVDPAEYQVGAVTQDQDDEEILELTDIVDASGLEPALESDVSSAPGPTGDIGDREMIPGSDDSAGRVTDEFEIEAAPTDFEPLSEAPAEESADTGDAISIGAIPLYEDERPRENSVIQLSDVLGQGMPKEEKLPIEQIKLGAEEELAKQPISLEAEVAADALGLDLEKESREVNNKVVDREIEAAVERIIQTKYAETIERLIAKAVEKAVTREIENIKRAMLDGDEPLS